MLYLQFTISTKWTISGNFRWLCTQPLNASGLKNYFFCCYCCCCCWGEIHLLPNSNSALKLGTRFVIGWENNRDVDITMLLSLETIGSVGYRDQWNKSFGRVLVNRKTSANNSYLGENALFSRIPSLLQDPVGSYFRPF